MTILSSRPPSYCSYLLRCWGGEDGSSPAWRFSLEDTGSGERHGFANLDALTGFLRKKMQSTCAEAGEPNVAVPP